MSGSNSDPYPYWNAQDQRHPGYNYSHSTQACDPDWNVAPQDNRRDSGLTNQGSPTTGGAISWSSGQQRHETHTAPRNPGHHGQVYAGSSIAQPGMYQTGYSATNNLQYTVGNHVQPTNNHSAQTESHTGRKLPRGTGPAINGEYTGQNLHYEELEPSYLVRTSNFFTEGKVFAVMWNETAGSTLKPVDYNTSRSYSEVKYAGNIVFTNVRRFVVVRRKREFCYACPIFTYSGRGCKKNGVHASEHAIAYSWGKSPQYVQGESGITKPSIAVVMASGVPDLDVASRIYFGIQHPIQYNVKVKEIGYVPAHQIHTLISNWTEENQGTNQAADVTENAD